MSVIAKVEPLYVREYALGRDVVCRVTKFDGSGKSEIRIMYFSDMMTEAEVEAEIGGSMEVSEVHFQMVFYLPVSREERPL